MKRTLCVGVDKTDEMKVEENVEVADMIQIKMMSLSWWMKTMDKVMNKNDEKSTLSFMPEVKIGKEKSLDNSFILKIMT